MQERKPRHRVYLIEAYTRSNRDIRDKQLQGSSRELQLMFEGLVGVRVIGSRVIGHSQDQGMGIRGIEVNFWVILLSNI